MKKKFWIGSIVAFVLVIAGSYALSATPFPPWMSAYFAQPPVLNEIHAKRTAKATYDVAAYGGATGSYDLGVTLPANATIVRSYMQVVTAFTNVSSSTLAIKCETANNILSAIRPDYIPFGVVDGVSTGASSVFKLITSACPLTATIATAAASTGKINIYVDYIVHD